MNLRFSTPRFIIFPTIYTLILLACSPATGSLPAPFPTQIFPSSQAPVQIEIISADQFSILNNSAAPIYYMVFPTELLPLIDWAPCPSIPDCEEIRILPADKLTLLFATVIDIGTQSLTVFWWQMDGDQGQPNPDYFFPQSISFPVP